MLYSVLVVFCLPLAAPSLYLCHREASMSLSSGTLWTSTVNWTNPHPLSTKREVVKVKGIFYYFFYFEPFPRYQRRIKWTRPIGFIANDFLAVFSMNMWLSWWSFLVSKRNWGSIFFLHTKIRWKWHLILRGHSPVQPGRVNTESFDRCKSWRIWGIQVEYSWDVLFYPAIL